MDSFRLIDGPIPEYVVILSVVLIALLAHWVEREKDDD
jgi:hypothetical protein